MADILQVRRQAKLASGPHPHTPRLVPYTRSAVRGADSVHDMALVVGMAIDKMLLLMGETTTRAEHTDRGIYANMRPEGVEDVVIIDEDED